MAGRVQGVVVNIFGDPGRFAGVRERLRQIRGVTIEENGPASQMGAGTEETAAVFPVFVRGEDGVPFTDPKGTIIVNAFSDDQILPVTGTVIDESEYPEGTMMGEVVNCLVAFYRTAGCSVQVLDPNKEL